MLKGFVSGEEKDIVSIPMKGKNLWDNPNTISKGQSPVYYEAVLGTPLPEGVYTFSAKVIAEAGVTACMVSFRKGTTGPIVASNIDVSSERTSITVTLTEPCYAVYLYGSTSYVTSASVTYQDIMLNPGDTALPYEPYGYQNGWEVRDNQDRIIWGREDELQTTTGTLPFKGYDLPVKVKSLLGNGVQNGTPSPDNIIVPEFCGVRTGNLWDNRGFSANAIQSTHEHVDTNTYGTTVSTTIGKEVIVTQSVYPTGTVGYQNGFFFIDVDFSKYEIGDKVTLSFDYICNEIHAAESQVSTTVYAGKNSNNVPSTLSSGNWSVSGRLTAVITIIANMNPYVEVRLCGNSITVKNIMLNSGSTVLPYEPYGYKITFENNGENLFDKSLLVTNMHLDNTTGLPVSYPGRITLPDPVDVSQYSTVTISYVASTTINAMYSIFSNNELVGRFTAVLSGTVIDVSNADKMYICFYSTYGGNIDTSSVSDIMLNSGSTPLPYSPYLNKTTPIYLGEVPTIRRIKKLVLTGTEENITAPHIDVGLFNIPVTDYLKIANVVTNICSHYLAEINVNGWSDVTDLTCRFYGNAGSPSKLLYIRDSSFSTVTDFKSYLTAQYANGTPVTVWYILSTPQTGIVNEPLAKIGDYADELTTIKVHGLSAPLYGIGEYKDTLNLSTGVVTRKVKRLVLDGTEGWSFASSNTNRTVCDILLRGCSGNFLCCSHIEWKSVYSTEEYNRIVWTNTSGGTLFVSIENTYLSGRDVAALKSYLAAQYQNGTPVTIWYVLSTPETETVTVPTGMTGEIEGYLTQISTPTPEHQSIPKWNGEEETGGTYAVTVYNLPEIETTTGKNTLTVETEKIHGLTNPLCGIGDYKDVLNLSKGIITRKIKKLVLTGEEDWIYRSGEPQNVYFLEFTEFIIVSNSGLCTHYPNQDSGGFNDLEDKHLLNKLSSDGTKSYIGFRDSSFSLLADFKAYLAQQYQNGTPVTVWYVPETTETETITVPYGLDCTVEGYLTQSETPTPSNPITPDSNGILESDGTYAVEVSLDPSNLTVKGHIKPIQ